MHIRGKLTGFWLVIAAAFFYSLYGVFSKLIGEAFAPFYQAWTRAAVTLLFFLLFGYYRKLFIRVKRKDIRHFLLVGLSGAFTVAPLFYSFTQLSLGAVLFLLYAGIVISGNILGVIIHNEKIEVTGFLSLALALLGLVLVYGFGLRFVSPLPVIAALAAGFFTSSYMVFSKKLSGEYSSLQINAIGYGVIVVANILMSTLLREAINTNFFSVEWLSNVGYAIAAFLGETLAVLGFKYLEAHRASIVLLTEIVFGLVFGYLFFAESLSLASAFGGFLIVIAAAVPYLKLNA